MADYLSRDEQIRLGTESIAGDKKAFSELHKHFNKALYGYITSRIENSEDTEDLVQETWIYCWEKKHSYNPDFSFFTFLHNFADIIIKRHKANQYKKISINDLTHQNSSEKLISKLVPFPDNAIISKELLCLTFNCCAKPHQLIAFGFSKLLEWRPREIVEKLSNIPLEDLANKLYQDYISYFHDIGGEIDDCIHPLLVKLKQVIRDVYTESEYQKLLSNLYDRTVGSTKLIDYFSSEAEASIYNWSHRVRERVQNITQGKRSICMYEKE